MEKGKLALSGSKEDTLKLYVNTQHYMHINGLTLAKQITSVCSESLFFFHWSDRQTNTSNII